MWLFEGFIVYARVSHIRFPTKGDPKTLCPHMLGDKKKNKAKLTWNIKCFQDKDSGLLNSLCSSFVLSIIY